MREASSRAASDRAGNSRSGFKVGISQTLEGVGVFTVRRCVPLHPHARTEHFPPSFLCQWGSTGGFQDVVILSHIPRIPLGMARVPGEVCSVFILPSVAPNPRLHTGREEKTKTFRERERTSPTSSQPTHARILKTLRRSDRSVVWQGLRGEGVHSGGRRPAMVQFC